MPFPTDRQQPSLENILAWMRLLERVDSPVAKDLITLYRGTVVRRILQEGPSCRTPFPTP